MVDLNMDAIPIHDKHVIEIAEIAMKTGRPIDFQYEGKTRLVEVHAVGISTAGNPVLRGYQIGGQSETGVVPIWRLFTIKKIFDFPAIVDMKAEAPRPGYKLGDKGMSEIFFEFPTPGEAGE